MKQLDNRIDRDLTVSEVSAILSVTNPTVYKMIATGRLDSYTVGRARRITIESLQRLRANNSSQH